MGVKINQDTYNYKNNSDKGALLPLGSSQCEGLCCANSLKCLMASGCTISGASNMTRSSTSSICTIVCKTRIWNICNYSCWGWDLGQTKWYTGSLCSDILTRACTLKASAFTPVQSLILLPMSPSRGGLRTMRVLSIAGSPEQNLLILSGDENQSYNVQIQKYCHFSQS